jgi:small GTP-binding protein
MKGLFRKLGLTSGGSEADLEGESPYDNVITSTAPLTSTTNGAQMAKTQKELVQIDNDTIKVLIVGDSGTGKTSLIKNYTTGKKNVTRPTVGVEFIQRNIEVGEKSYKCQFVDSAGQDIFQSITQKFYHGSHAVVIVYDVTKPDTWHNVRKWLKNVQEHGSESVIVNVIGNKIDIQARHVTTEEAKEYCDKVDLGYFECSAEVGTNVENTFDETLIHVLKAAGVKNPVIEK